MPPILDGYYFHLGTPSKPISVSSYNVACLYDCNSIKTLLSLRFNCCKIYSPNTTTVRPGLFLLIKIIWSLKHVLSVNTKFCYLMFKYLLVIIILTFLSSVSTIKWLFFKVIVIILPFVLEWLLLWIWLLISVIPELPSPSELRDMCPSYDWNKSFIKISNFLFENRVKILFITTLLTITIINFLLF